MPSLGWPKIESCPGARVRRVRFSQAGRCTSLVQELLGSRQEKGSQLLEGNRSDHAGQEFYSLNLRQSHGQPIVIQAQVFLASDGHQPVKGHEILDDKVNVHKVLGLSPVEKR